MKKTIHLIPNVLTALGLTCGLFVIFKLNMAPIGGVESTLLLQSAGLLLLAGIFDLLDGAVARAMDAESEFGGIFDSLADAISFGVAPAVVVLKSVSMPPGTIFSFLITTAALVFTVSGVMRLVRYSTNSRRLVGEVEGVLESKKHFTGLPIPAAAAAAVSLNLVLLSADFQSYVPVSDHQRTLILFGALVLLGYLMISRWKFPSLKTMQFRVASFERVFATVLIAACIFWGLIYWFSLVFAVLSWGYLLIAMGLSLTRYVLGKRASSLEDYEVDEESSLDGE